MNNVIIPAISTTLSAIFFYLIYNSILSIGDLVSNYFPCKEELIGSLSCFGTYDIYVMFILAVVFLSSLIVLFIRLNKKGDPNL